mmetsp:Transcript_6732/g.18195  ORF Transcript_6732/g.18195 Transcript_6732/m.18195 type:complete len:287 (-) Transcript_6732:259-1119(-)
MGFTCDSTPESERSVLFPLSNDELLDAIVVAIAARIDASPSLGVPQSLLPLHEANFDLSSERVFDGARESVYELLAGVVHAGLEPKALIISYCFVERVVARVHACDPSRNACIPASTAKAVIIAAVMLSSKYHYDKGVRMCNLRADAGMSSSLGDGLLRRYGGAEEHMLTLLDWALRVGPDEYTAAYNTLIQLVAKRTHSKLLADESRPVQHVNSFPSELSRLTPQTMRKRRHSPLEPASRADLAHADGSRGAPARLETGLHHSATPSQPETAPMPIICERAGAHT